jgi:hypothetical protein
VPSDANGQNDGNRDSGDLLRHRQTLETRADGRSGFQCRRKPFQSELSELIGHFGSREIN